MEPKLLAAFGKSTQNENVVENDKETVSDPVPVSLR